MTQKIETEFIEFKESTSQTSRALEAIVAMLNKHGSAKVLFGVKDNGEIIGQKIGNKTLKDLSAAITTRIKPSVIPDIEIEIHDDKSVIVVEVNGYNKPYCADGQYLIRSGNENRKIDPEIMKEMVFTNSTELSSSIESINQDMTFNQLKQLYIMNGYTIDDKTFNGNTGLLTANGKYNILAEILSDNNNCSIKVVRFAGKDKSEMIARNEYGYKCLILAMKQALDYVNSLNETRVVLGGGLMRQEVKLFDEKCLREAWSNACLHNRWDKMIPPAIYIFSDRIEIVSTGGLPLDFSANEFFEGISHPINIQLQKIMGKLGIVEQTGHGVPEIVKTYGKEAFELAVNHITVTFTFPYELNNENKVEYSGLTKSQKKVFEAMRISPSITTADLSKVLNCSIPRISQIIRELREMGYLKRVGSRKDGYWQVL